MTKKKYRVRPNRTFGARKQYKGGAVVFLTEEEAVHLDDILYLDPDQDEVPTEPEPEPEPEAPQGDDLTQIDGIGPATAKKLGELGVTTFSALAGLIANAPHEIADALPRVSEEDLAAWAEQLKDK